MNILIVGEFSGFAKHLQSGFELLGHKVVVVKDGDGFKKIPHSKDDIVYDSSRCLRVFGRRIPLSNMLWFKMENKKIADSLSLHGCFDLIVVICDIFVTVDNSTVGVSLEYLREQVSKGTKLIFTSCGGDAAYSAYRKELKYHDIAFPRNFRNYLDERLTRKKRDRLNNILELSRCVIVTAWDYFYTINRYIQEQLNKEREVYYCQLPIMEEPYTIQPCENRKIVVFHGVIRAQRKGTPFIISALEKIKRDFPDKVEVTVRGHMPYQEYVELFDKIDVLIDQTNGYGTGINANIGLMRGKVVLSNNEIEEEELRGYKSPVVGIQPDSNQIYEVLKDLIFNPEKIDRIKQESRDYAMEHLRSDIIAKSYIEFARL